MPAPGTVWATDTWSTDAWAADTWADSLTVEPTPSLPTRIVLTNGKGTRAVVTADGPTRASVGRGGSRAIIE